MIDKELANEIWRAVEAYVPQKKKVIVALQIIDSFEKYGCSNIYEAVDLADAAGVNALNFEEDES